MNFWRKVFGSFSEKQTEYAIAMYELGMPQNMENNYEAMSTDGYKKNIVAYHCINLLSSAVSSLPVVLYSQTGRKKKEEVEEHEIYDLISHPNSIDQTKETFLQVAAMHLLIAGEAFWLGCGPGSEKPGNRKTPKEIINIRPDHVEVTPGMFGHPQKYTVDPLQNAKVFPVSPINGDSQLLMMKRYNPTNRWRGMSPIEAAAFNIDQLNAQGQWNLALLQNGARPSGAFVMNKGENNPKGQLTPEQRAHLKQQLENNYAVAGKKGGMILLEGGMDYKEMGLSPKDMDWIESKNVNSVDVAQAFGVPPQMVGVKGHDTYANWKEARLAFYTDTVIPMMRFVLGYMNSWLVPTYQTSGKSKLFLDIDLDAIEALAPLRAERWTSAKDSTWLTTNEKRELTGYGRYEGSKDPADKILVGSGQIPLEMAAEEIELEPEPELDLEDVSGEPPKEVEEEQPEKMRGPFAVIDLKAFNLGSRTARQRYASVAEKRRLAFEKTFEAQLRANFKREANMVANVIEGLEKDTAIVAIDQVILENQKSFEDIFAKNDKRIMRAFGKDVLAMPKFMRRGMETKQAEDVFEQEVEQYIRKTLGTKITNISKTTRRRVKASVEKHFADGGNLDGLASVIQDSYNGFSKGRAYTIARTETHSASQYASREAAKALDIKGMQKDWISIVDDRSRGAGDADTTNHISMDGTRIGIDEKFSVPSVDGMDEMDGPGDPSAPVDQIANCRCVTAYVVEET